jgi:hypothetical protein
MAEGWRNNDNSSKTVTRNPKTSATPANRALLIILKKVGLPSAEQLGKRGAEGVGFEPTRERNPLPVFKTGALNHSATLPHWFESANQCDI